MCEGGFSVVSSVVNARPARIGPTVCDEDGPIPMRHLSKTDSGRGAVRTGTRGSRGSVGSRHGGGVDIADVVDPLVLERLRTRLNGALAGRRAADRSD
mgnify:CR=1 FL=1